MRIKLRQARVDKGLTQQQVANELGICLRHYKYIEAGKVVGNVELWDKLEDMFNVHQRVLRENHLDKEDSR